MTCSKGPQVEFNTLGCKASVHRTRARLIELPVPRTAASLKPENPLKRPPYLTDITH